MKRCSICSVLCLTMTLLVSVPVFEVRSQEPRYQDRTLAEWAAMINDTDGRARLLAVEALGHFGSAAAATLVQGLADDELDVRVQAAQSLGAIGGGGPDAERALAVALTKGPPRLRRVVAEVLGRVRPLTGPAVGALIEALADGDPQVWDNAASSLQVSVPASLPSVLEALNSVQPRVRLGAAFVLRRIVRSGDLSSPAWDQIVQALIQAATDRDAAVRNEVVHALGSAGRRAASATAVLGTIQTDDPDDAVRRAASRALSEIGPEKAVD